MLQWSSTAAYSGAKDLALSRTSAGLLQINSGTANKWGGAQMGLLSMQSLATPTGLSVTPQGTGGSATWTYVGQACLADGVTCTEVSADVSTTSGNATLDTTNKNRLAWGAVTGATSYIWRRKVSGGTPATLGAFACTTVTATSCDDVGAAGDGVTGPTNNQTGSIVFGSPVTPTAATDACAAGRFWWDTSYIYLCTATGAIKRAAISTWP